MNDLISTADACKALGFGPDTIRKMADAGSIRCVKSDSGHRRYYKSSVLEVLARMQSNAANTDIPEIADNQK